LSQKKITTDKVASLLAILSVLQVEKKIL